MDPYATLGKESAYILMRAAGAAITAIMVLAICSFDSSSSAAPADVLSPNNNKDINTATLQHSFVVEVLTNYAKPLVPIDVAGEQVQTYAQASDGVMSQYAKDQQEIAAQAISCMKSELARNPTRPALVLDIDETSLSNLWKILEEPFLAATTAAGTEARYTGDEPAIEATRKLYGEAIANDVAVFFISGRTNSQRQATEENLKSAGFTTWEKLVTIVDETEPAGPYKAAEREKIRQDGWTIITNVGDQFSDLNGADGKPDAPCAFKLPNPYYEIP